MIYCNKCGNENKTDNKFCSSCGNSLVALNEKNPTKGLEIFLKLLNSIIGTVSIGFVLLSFGLWLVMLIVCAFGGTACMEQAEDKNLLNFMLNGNGLGIVIGVFVIVMLILLVINILTVIKMKSINKKTNYIGKYRVKKSTYIVLAFFFGMFGVHRFAANDKKMGYIHLALFSLNIIVLLLFKIFPGIGVLLPLGFVLALVSDVLGLTDGIIAISKISNEKGEITI